MNNRSVSTIRPRFVDEQGRVRRFKSRWAWTAAAVLESYSRHGGLLPCHLESIATLKRSRNATARGIAAALERLRKIEGIETEPDALVTCAPTPASSKSSNSRNRPL